MIKRKLQEQIIKSLSKFPVVGLLGARQVGKTTLAKMIQSEIQSQTVYLDLELDEDLFKLQEPQIYFQQHQDALIIIDEIQHKKDLCPLIRALVDRDRRPRRFMVLGY